MCILLLAVFAGGCTEAPPPEEDHTHGGPITLAVGTFNIEYGGTLVDFDMVVEAVEAGRLIRLRAEMKLPGRAWLQFEALPQPAGGALLVQTAFFEPHGLAGLAYWYGLYPLHQLIFSGIARAIARRAESHDR